MAKRKIPDEKLIEALLKSANMTEAARAAGVGKTVLFERRRDPAFMAKLRGAQAESLEGTTRFLQTSTAAAAETLVEIATQSGRPAQARIAAARAILDAATRFTEVVDYGARLEALERYADGGGDDEP